MVNQDRRISEKIIWCLTVFLLSSFYIFDANKWISVILVCVTATIFIISLFQKNWAFTFKFERFHMMIIIFALYCMASSLWAKSPGESVQKSITITEILICMSLILIHYHKFNTIKQLINAIMFAGFLVSVYAIVFYGLDTIQSVMAAGERLESSFANINSIGLASAVSIVIAVYNIMFLGKKNLVLLIFSAPAILIVAASGSRKALMLTIIGVVLDIMLRYRSKNYFKLLVRWCFVGIILFFAIRFIVSLPFFSVVSERMKGLNALVTGSGEVDHSAWLREQYIKYGIQQFYKTPILGIGIANSNYITLLAAGESTYLHNNYVELLACGGLVGFTLYYSMYVYLIYNLIKYRDNDDPYFFLCCILMLIQLVMDYGAVSYYSKSTYFYFMTFFMEVKILKQKNLDANVEPGKYEQVNGESLYV